MAAPHPSGGPSDRGKPPGPPPVPETKHKKPKRPPPPVPTIIAQKDGGDKRRSKRKKKDPAEGAYVDGSNEKVEEEPEEIEKTLSELVVEYLYSNDLWQSARDVPKTEGDGLTAEEEAEIMLDDPDIQMGEPPATGGGDDGDNSSNDEDDYDMYSSDGEDDVDDLNMQHRCTDPCVYNRQYNQMLNIATMSTTIHPARLLDLKSTAMEMVPVVHEETQAYYRAKLARYKRDDYVPNRDPCIICKYGFTDDIDEESNEVVRDFVLIFLEQQDLVSPEVLFDSMCDHWNNKIVGAFKRFATRTKFLLTPSAIEEHFTGGCRFDVSVILRSEIEFVRQLIDHQKVQGVYVAKVKYGVATGVIETDTAQVRNLLSLYRQLLDLVRTQQTFLTNSKFIARYGANPERYSSGNQSYGKEFNRLGTRVMNDKARLEQSSTKS